MSPKTLVALLKTKSQVTQFFYHFIKHLSIQSLCGVVSNQHHPSDKVSQVWEIFVSMIQVIPNRQCNASNAFTVVTQTYFNSDHMIDFCVVEVFMVQLETNST